MKPPLTLDSFDAQFRAIESMLRAQLDDVRARLQHSGNKGATAEVAFRDALARFLPRRLQLGTGEIIDTQGRRSAQCDLVIATDHHPNWFHRDNPALFLIEAVAGAAEVKSLLTSGHLNSAIANTRLFRELRPDWGSHTEIVSSESDARRFYRSPPFFLFAYESQLALETVADRLEAATDESRGRSGESIDGVFVLNQGFVLNFGDGKGAFVAQAPAGGRLSGYYWDDTRTPLLTLMMWLPVSLTVPVSQIPVLSQYLLGDASRVTRQAPANEETRP